MLGHLPGKPSLARMFRSASPKLVEDPPPHRLRFFLCHVEEVGAGTHRLATLSAAHDFNVGAFRKHLYVMPMAPLTGTHGVESPTEAHFVEEVAELTLPQIANTHTITM
jgi:hypothetical protein